MARYKNITTGTTTTLISKHLKSSGTVSGIVISNNDGHQADNVCLFLEDETVSTSTNAGNTKFYFFKDVDIPYGASLMIDQNLSFDGSKFHLRIVTQNAADGGTPNLTVTIK
jgi:hypothetical protein